MRDLNAFDAIDWCETPYLPGKVFGAGHSEALIRSESLTAETGLFH
jgi:hypothetical protein